MHPESLLKIKINQNKNIEKIKSLNGEAADGNITETSPTAPLTNFFFTISKNFSTGKKSRIHNQEAEWFYFNNIFFKTLTVLISKLMHGKVLKTMCILFISVDFIAIITGKRKLDAGMERILNRKNFFKKAWKMIIFWYFSTCT